MKMNLKLFFYKVGFLFREKKRKLAERWRRNSISQKTLDISLKLFSFLVVGIIAYGFYFVITMTSPVERIDREIAIKNEQFRIFKKEVGNFIGHDYFDKLESFTGNTVDFEYDGQDIFSGGLASFRNNIYLNFLTLKEFCDQSNIEIFSYSDWRGMLSPITNLKFDDSSDECNIKMIESHGYSKTYYDYETVKSSKNYLTENDFLEREHRNHFMNISKVYISYKDEISQLNKDRFFEE